MVFDVEEMRDWLKQGTERRLISKCRGTVYMWVEMNEAISRFSFKMLKLRRKDKEKS